MNSENRFTIYPLPIYRRNNSQPQQWRKTATKNFPHPTDFHFVWCAISSHLHTFYPTRAGRHVAVGGSRPSDGMWWWNIVFDKLNFKVFLFLVRSLDTDSNISRLLLAECSSEDSKLSYTSLPHESSSSSGCCGDSHTHTHTQVVINIYNFLFWLPKIRIACSVSACRRAIEFQISEVLLAPSAERHRRQDWMWNFVNNLFCPGTNAISRWNANMQRQYGCWGWCGVL